MKITTRQWLVTTGLYMILLTLVSLRPAAFDAAPSRLKEIVHNLMHVPAYAGLAFLLMCTLRMCRLRAAVVWTFLLALGYGGLMEVLQGFSVGRTPSFGDLGLNALGAGLVVGLSRHPRTRDLLRPRRRRGEWKLG